VQNIGVKLELNSTGSGGYFIEAYAGIDLHSSNNSSFATKPAQGRLPMMFLSHFSSKGLSSSGL
jgi:hypothetical protein